MKDIHEVLRVGQIVSVRVLEIDLPRKRISLSMKTRSDKSVTTAATPETKAQKSVKKPTPVKELSLMASKLKAALKKEK